MATHLESSPCEAYGGDVHVRPSVKQDQHVYYPDVMLACRWEQIGEGFMINSKLIVEGLSPSTAGVDRCETAQLQVDFCPGSVRSDRTQFY